MQAYMDARAVVEKVMSTRAGKGKVANSSSSPHVQEERWLGLEQVEQQQQPQQQQQDGVQPRASLLRQHLKQHYQYQQATAAAAAEATRRAQQPQQQQAGLEGRCAAASHAMK